MKGIIFYYSGTGNTVLACQYIVNNVRNAEIELFDILGGSEPDLSSYDFAGFATFTDYWAPPGIFLKFIDSLPGQEKKPAFVFNTYGMISAKTLSGLDEAASVKGFHVVAGYSLHMPENYPPIIKSGMGNENAPSNKELAEFKAFVRELDDLAARLGKGETIKAAKIKVNMAGKMMPDQPRDKAVRVMGEKFVDEDLCTGCGTCANICPNGTITVDSKPHWDMAKCTGCWACYNQCLFKAIYTKKLRGVGHYSGPSAELVEKLR